MDACRSADTGPPCPGPDSASFRSKSRRRNGSSNVPRACALRVARRVACSVDAIRARRVASVPAAIPRALARVNCCPASARRLRRASAGHCPCRAGLPLSTATATSMSVSRRIEETQAAVVDPEPCSIVAVAWLGRQNTQLPRPRARIPGAGSGLRRRISGMRTSPKQQRPDSISNSSCGRPAPSSAPSTMPHCRSGSADRRDGRCPAEGSTSRSPPISNCARSGPPPGARPAP